MPPFIFKLCCIGFILKRELDHHPSENPLFYKIDVKKIVFLC